MPPAPAFAPTNAPAVAPLRPGGGRPRFSVMIPACDPDEKFCASLDSVLRQAPGPERMQIAVVDDASSAVDVQRLIRSVDPQGRVEFFGGDRRRGLSGNWNRAIEVARGELVHLLHQDDSVHPGFYDRLERGFTRCPQIGMAFCRSRIIDDSGRLTKKTSRQRWLPGVLADWLPVIAERQRVQTPAAIVPRSTYETIGGYRTDLCHALDWEMWVRIAAHFRVWYEPRPLAIYRRHDANETSRLFASGAIWPDMARALRINAATLPDAVRDSTLAASVRWHAASAMRTAERQLAAGATAEAAHTLRSIPDILDVLHGRSVEGVATRRLAALRARLRSDGRERRAA
ncbi:MAG: glycosyltransferase family 2 protein [Planctomycetota bacterium]